MTCLFICLHEFRCDKHAVSLLQKNSRAHCFFPAVLISEGKRREGEESIQSTLNMGTHPLWCHRPGPPTASTVFGDTIASESRQLGTCCALWKKKKCQWTWLFVHRGAVTLASLMRVMFALINGNHISLRIFWNELSFWKGCANSLSHFCCPAHH